MIDRTWHVAAKIAVAIALTTAIVPAVIGATSPLTQAPGAVAEASKTPQVFEVVSVKENRSGSLQSNFVTTPGRVTATNVGLYQLISVAYNGAPMPLGSLEGVPSWAFTDHYDIVATHSGQALSSEQFQQAMRALLADRFGLRMHQEPRERPLYVLSLANRNASFGQGLRRSTIDCDNPQPAESRPSEASRAGVAPCQLRTFPGHITGRAITIDQLVKVLVGAVEDHREIKDGTGLDGRFDVELEWLPDRPVVDLRPADAPSLPAVDANGAPLMTALREQLGLRLDLQNASANVWVIDGVQRPTSN